MKTKKLTVIEGVGLNLCQFPRVHASFGVKIFKKQYNGDVLLVRCGKYIYNVSSNPSIYEQAK